MEREDELEEYLRSAPIMFERPLPGGGGHIEKKILWLRGGVAVAAKPGTDANHAEQARCEVAAWLLASELDMTKIVPVTVMRPIPTNMGDVDGSVQVMWGQFKMAMMVGLTPPLCPDPTGWEIAIFDVLSANVDRHNGNWGIIENTAAGATPEVVCVDHGHCFLKAPQTSSPFATDRLGQTIPADLLDRLRVFAKASSTRLTEVLHQTDVDQVVDRARHLVQGGVLAIP